MHPIFMTLLFLAYCVILEKAGCSCMSIEKNRQHEFNPLFKSDSKSSGSNVAANLDNNDDRDQIDKNNDSFFFKSARNDVELGENQKLKINKGGKIEKSADNNEKIMRFKDRFLSYPKIPSASNIHLSQTTIDNLEGEEHGSQDRIPDSIVKKFGAAPAELSAEHQNKVIYIPIYDSDQSIDNGNHKSHYQNVPNDVYNRPQNNAGKKIVGLIGVTFVKKSQHGHDISLSQSNDNDNHFLHQPVNHDIQEQDLHELIGVLNSNNEHQMSVDMNANPWIVQNVDDQGWKGSSGNPQSHGISQGQGHISANQGKPWLKGNQKSNSGQNFPVNKNNHPGYVKVYREGNMNFAKNRPISENPLFPTRTNSHGNPMRGKLPNNPNTSKGKNIHMHSAVYMNNGKTKTQKQFPHGANNAWSNNVNKGNPISTTDASKHFIPVIKHIIITKEAPVTNKYNPSDNRGQYPNQNKGHHGKSNYHTQNQNTQYSPKFVISNQKNSDNYKGAGNLNSNNHQNHHKAPNNSKYNHMQNQPPHLSHNKGNQNVQFTIPEGYQIVSKNYHDNSNTLNQGNIDSDLQTKIMHPISDGVIENIDYIVKPHVLVLENSENSGNNHHSFQPPSQSKHHQNDNLNALNVANDEEIRKALEVAGIYLQNQNIIPAQSRSSPPGNYRFHTGSQDFKQVKENNLSTTYLNNIRPTTDQRYNALVHEQNNNFNIATMAKMFHHPPQNIQQAKGYENANFIPFQNLDKTNSEKSAKSFQIGGEQFIRLPMEENGWKVIKNINTPSNIASINSRNINMPPHPVDVSNVDYVENANHQNSRQDSNSDVKLIYGISPEQLRNRFPEFYRDNKKDGTVVFTGINNGNWGTNANHINKQGNDLQQRNSDLQQRNSAEDDHRVTKGSSKSVQPGTLFSNIKSNSGSDIYNKATNAWSQRDYEDRENDKIKKNSGKNDNNNMSNNKHADGADSNGFGGESFW